MAKTDDDTPTTRPQEVEDAIAELKLVMEAEADQRELEEDDLTFDAGHRQRRNPATADVNDSKT